jgi:hypothetical protein
MNPHDQSRFAKLIADFVAGCNFDPPFHLVVIDARGSVSVTCYGVRGVERVCAGPSKAARFKMIQPLTVTCISSEGTGRSAVITIEGAQPATMQ